MNGLKHLTATVGVVIVALWGFFAQPATAAPVEPDQAQRVARNFWNMHRDLDVKPLEGDLTAMPTAFDGMYIFTNGDGEGFVIVAAEDCVRPVLGYSFHNTFDVESNANVRYWLGGYQEQIEWCRANDWQADEATAAEWQQLLEVKGTLEPHPLTATAPLLNTAWDQSPYYNALCPFDSEHNTRTPAGCIVTAMAQVMKYWEHPVHGTGSHSYTHSKYGTLSANFAATTYDWDNMPYSLTGASSNAQKTAVATLMYHCGVAVEMDYDYDASGAYMTGGATTPCTKNALIQYFGYVSTLHNVYRSSYSDNQWTNLIKTELDSLWPVLYSGYDQSGGHAFVCDGYNSNGQYHFNWGWGGVSDGYYLLSNLAPGTGGTGGNATYTFNQGQHALLGVHPSSTSVPPDPDPEPVDDNCIIQYYPYTMDFDQGGYDCLTLNDVNGDGVKWGLIRGSGVGGSICAYIKYAAHSNDYINMPYIAEPGTYTVTWKAKAHNASYPESYEVWAEGERIFEETLSSTSYVDRSADFTVHHGDTVRVRFRYISDDQYYFYVDNVVITQNTSFAGIDGAEAMPTPRLYPNPATDRVTVETPEGATISLIDLNGRTVTTCKADGTSTTLELGRLTAGMYLVRVTTEQGIQVGRIVKK